LFAALQAAAADCVKECRTLPFLIVPAVDALAGPLREIYESLCNFRGQKNFASAGRVLACDFVIPSRKLIIEYDERQHFTEPRAMARDRHMRVCHGAKLREKSLDELAAPRGICSSLSAKTRACREIILEVPNFAPRSLVNLEHHDEIAVGVGP
jgi:hypothetical protein